MIWYIQKSPELSIILGILVALYILQFSLLSSILIGSIFASHEATIVRMYRMRPLHGHLPRRSHPGYRKVSFT